MLPTIRKQTQSKTNGKMSLLRLQHKENVLILNTPNRQEILKDGPSLELVKNNLLGRGAYGTVIKAVYKAKPVALKIIKNLKDVNNQILHNEAHILGWKHPNIVRILKIESTTNFAIVIMERFEGQCLQSVLDAIDIPIVHRILIAKDIILALTYCHKKGLMHMDIKPQNVMISLNRSQTPSAILHSRHTSYICKLCDFGSSIKLNDSHKNTKGFVKGTLRYMAPEALKEESLTPAADIYSLGVTLWQMKYRHSPYYWLQCNEVVAYQVVKHKLRPNAHGDVDGENRHNANTRSGICLCETYSTHMSSESLENLFKILNKNECDLITEPSHDGGDCISLSVKRMPLKDLHYNSNGNIKTIKVKRNLQNEFTLTDAFALSPVLQGAHCANAEHAERLYEDIFISCWHSDYKQRPSSAELCIRFNKLL